MAPLNVRDQIGKINLPLIPFDRVHLRGHIKAEDLLL